MAFANLANGQASSGLTTATPTRPEGGVDPGLALANLTDITVICVERYTQQFRVHSSLLVQSSRWFEQREREINDGKSVRPTLFGSSTTPTVITIPAPHTPSAVDIFVRYVYQKDVIPHTTLFAHHGIEAFLLSQLLDSPDFARCCERALEHVLAREVLKPSLLELQAMLQISNFPGSIRSLFLENVANRMISATFDFHKGDEYLVEGHTWRALCTTIATKARNNNARSGENGSSSGNAPTTIPTSYQESQSDGNIRSHAKEQNPTQDFSNRGWPTNTPNSIHNTGDLFGLQRSSTVGPTVRETSELQPAVDVLGNVRDGNVPSTFVSRSNGFGVNTNNGGLFGQNQYRTSNSSGLFGNTAQKNTNAGSSLFGSTTQKNNGNNDGLIGRPLGGGLFGKPSQCATNAAQGLFGRQQTQPNDLTAPFAHNTTAITTSTNSTSIEGLFGRNQAQAASATSCVGQYGQSANKFSSGPTSNKAGFTFGNTTTPDNRPPGGGSANGTMQSSSCFWHQKPQSGAILPLRTPDHGTFSSRCCLYDYSLGKGTEAIAPTYFQPLVEKEANDATSVYQHICFHQDARNFSPEELRLVDYNNHRFGLQQLTQPQAPASCEAVGTFPDKVAVPLHKLRGTPSAREIFQTTSQKSDYISIKGGNTQNGANTTEPTNAKRDVDEEFSNLIRELKAQLTHLQKDTKELKARQDKQEQHIIDTIIKPSDENDDSSTSTPVLIFTPTSSAGVSPKNEPFATNTTTIEHDDFICIESHSPTKKVHFNDNTDALHISTTNANGTESKDKTRARKMDHELSFEARLVYRYLQEHSSPFATKYIQVQTLADKLGLARERVFCTGMELLGKGLIHPAKIQFGGDTSFAIVY